MMCSEGSYYNGIPVFVVSSDAIIKQIISVKRMLCYLFLNSGNNIVTKCPAWRFCL